MIKKIFKWVGNILFLLLIFIVASSFYSALQAKRNPGHIPSIMGYRLMTVLSGSMSPVIEAGDMIVAKNIDPENIEIGDVITYRVDQDTFVTHRVMEITEQEGKLAFKTKGDANNIDDQSLVTPEQVIGSLAFRIPYGGYISNFVRSPIGFILFILIPIILLIGGEIKSIIKELKKDKKALKNS